MGIDTIFWLAAIVIFAVVEGATTALVSVWFAVGAGAAAIFSMFNNSPFAQFVVFVVVSAIALAIMVPMLAARRKQNGAPVTNGAPLSIGKRGIVLRAINPGEVGRVRVDGLDWQAVSAVALPQDEKIVVIGVDGANLVVDAAEKTAVQQN